MVDSPKKNMPDLGNFDIAAMQKMMMDNREDIEAILAQMLEDAFKKDDGFRVEVEGLFAEFEKDPTNVAPIEQIMLKLIERVNTGQ